MTATRARGGALWLRAPTRYAGLARAPASALAAAILACLLLLTLAPRPDVVATPDTGRDPIELHQSITDAMRGGESYYPAAARRLREAGLPLRPLTAIHLPTINVLHAAVPAELIRLAYWLLAGITALAWAWRLQFAFRPYAGLFVAMALLASGLSLFTLSDLHLWPEAWAGTLVALSLARWQGGRAGEAAGYAVMAMLIRELAVLYPIVMITAAMIEGRRREAVTWAAAMLVLAAAMVAHGLAVAGVTGPVDPVQTDWLPFGGVTMALDALVAASPLRQLPDALGWSLVVLALLGWSAWRESLGPRIAALVALVAAVMALGAPAGATHLAAIATPVLLVGLAFLPDMVRDLARAILDMRRVRVHRITR